MDYLVDSIPNAVYTFSRFCEDSIRDNIVIQGVRHILSEMLFPLDILKSTNSV